MSLRSADHFLWSVQTLSEETLDGHFDLLEKTLKKNNLFKKASRIYNMNESGVPLCHEQPKNEEPEKSMVVLVRIK